MLKAIEGRGKGLDSCLARAEGMLKLLNELREPAAADDLAHRFAVQPAADERTEPGKNILGHNAFLVRPNRTPVSALGG